MSRYVALLRGIMPSNPAMSNDKLRGVLEGLGMEQVGSVLASGNIVFTAPGQDVPGPPDVPDRPDVPDVPDLESRIQTALHETLGIAGGTIVRELSELRALLDRDPFEGLTHGRGTYLTVTFLKDGAARPAELPTDPDPLTRVVGFDEPARAFLAVIDNSEPGRTPDFMTWLDRTYGKDITTRTWLTVQRIVRKIEATG